jgi:hypothetical protein
MCSGNRRPLVVAALVVCTVATTAAQSRRTIAELGRLDPPAYVAPLVRGGDPAPVFDDALLAYRGRRYEAAADLLRRFVTAEPDDPAGNFFLAVSLMMTDEVGEAEDRIGVVLAGGESPFAMAARFVRAKAKIRLRDLAAAERDLSVVAQSGDRYAREAAELAVKVRAAMGRK